METAAKMFDGRVLDELSHLVNMAPLPGVMPNALAQVAGLPLDKGGLGFTCMDLYVAFDVYGVAAGVLATTGVVLDSELRVLC
jgi:hypothetical protein